MQDAPLTVLHLAEDARHDVKLQCLANRPDRVSGVTGYVHVKATGTGHSVTARCPEGDVVLGGGNSKRLGKLPRGARLGSNANAFKGGFRLWDDKR